MSIKKNEVLGSFYDQLDKQNLKSIEELYKKINEESEFEFMFFNYKKDINRMGLEHFLRILEFLTYRSKKDGLKLENVITLDLNYSKQTGEVYRISILGINSINKYIKVLHNRKNHVIFSALVGLSQRDDTIKLFKKVKERVNIIDINDFDIRIRLSKETNVTKKEMEELLVLDEKVRNNIIFRYKQRISLKLEQKKDMSLSIDLTNIKMSKNINKIEESIPNYELEIDLTNLSKKVESKYLSLMFSETNKLLKVIQQSNFIISRTLEKEVIDSYKKLLGIVKESLTSLEGRKPQSLEIQHVVDQLPDKYAVTDKADGERFFLIIFDNTVFLISDLINVRNTGLIIPEKMNKFNNSILDGELIFIESENRYIFMCFDCLINGGKDIRQISNLVERLQNADEIIENCFILKNQKGFKLVDYSGKFDMNEILKYQNKNIEKYIEALNHDIQFEKQIPLIRRKYFIPVLGGQHNEIFKYSELLWNKFIFDKNIHCPYILDGLIYQPTIQKYITSVKESKYIDYKWKPEEKNSIDFYVQFERSRDTGKIVTLFDNSREDDQQIRGKAYKILKLYVGKVIRGIEQPVLFEPETDSIRYLAYIYLQDNEARDIEGNIIQDSTVVEFYYNNDPNISDKNRWVPIRTRYDKTESVQRFGKKYGNYIDIAYKVWRSIRNPFTMNDITILSRDDIYEKHISILRGKIDHSIILSERKENIYYQKRTTLAKPMRNFHNWIKSILIYTNVNPIYEPNNKLLSVLDIACGRGGDLMKFYYVQVEFYVGVDKDNNGLISPVDGAISRYNQLRKTHPNFPRMFFIHADGGVLLNYEDQFKALGGMSGKNKDLMDKFFSKENSKRTKFDRINCQFAIHYFFENQIIWDNFTQNVKDYLKPGGYMIITTFDADRILELLDKSDQYTAFYTDTNGQQQTLFEIVKKFENIKKNDLVGVGVPIDFHNSLDFQEGVYITEYLVQKKFIEKEFLEKCDMELIETDLFENQYLINENFFVDTYKYEDNEKTRKFLKDASEYYTSKTEVNNASFKLTRLYRYYIFRKKDEIINVQTNKTDKTNKTNKTRQKGGVPILNMTGNDYIFNEAVDFINPTKFIKRDLTDSKDLSFMFSIHDILKNSEIIPKNTTPSEFYNDISVKMFNDKKVNQRNINKLNDNLVIKHDYSISDLSSEIALNGINIFLIEKDCDGSSILNKYGKNGKINKTVPTSILFNDGNKYYPIYKIKNKQMVGMFDTNSDFIKNLLNK